MKRSIVLFFGMITILFACNSNKETETTTDADTLNRSSDTTSNPSVVSGHAQAILAGTKSDTTVSGTVNFDTLAGGKIKMMLDLTIPNLAGKTVAVHIHEHGDCGSMGELAHAHWNPGNKSHGKWGSGDFHAGDIGNVKLDSKGNGKMNLETDLWSIGGTSSSDIRGKSIIVHSGMDDYKTQPSGNSGSRIGCGVIQ